MITSASPEHAPCVCWPDCCCHCWVANAEDFDVRTANIRLADGAWVLTARIDYHLTDKALAALDNGVTLTFRVEASITRERPWWTDPEVVDAKLDWRLSFEPLTKRYLVQYPDDREETSYATLFGALNAIGRVQSLPIAEAVRHQGRRNVRRGRAGRARSAEAARAAAGARVLEQRLQPRERLVRMDDRTVKPSRGSLALAACLAAGVAGLVLLTLTVENSDVFGRWHDTILIANLLGALALLVVLAVNLVQPAPRPAADGCRARASSCACSSRSPPSPPARCSSCSWCRSQFLHQGIETWADSRIATGPRAVAAALARRAGRRAAHRSRQDAARQRPALRLRAGADDRGTARDPARVGRRGDDRLRAQLPDRRHQQRGRTAAASRNCPAKTCCCSCHATAATWRSSRRARTNCRCARPWCSAPARRRRRRTAVPSGPVPGG